MSESLLPFHVGNFAKALEECFDERLKQIEIPISRLWNVDICAAELLPYLAEAFACEIWDSDWPEDKKRATLKVWLRIRAKRGTVYSIKETFRQLGITIDIIEWWQKASADGIRKTFEAYFWLDENSSGKLADEGYLGRIIDSLKPVAAHPGFAVGVRVQAKEVLVGQFSTVEVIRLRAE